MVMGFIGLLVNIPVNYIFIYGHFGMPELGGVGCGVATAAVYWVMFLAMVSYIKRARSMRDIRNEKRHREARSCGYETTDSTRFANCAGTVF